MTLQRLDSLEAQSERLVGLRIGGLKPEWVSSTTFAEADVPDECLRASEARLWTTGPEADLPITRRSVAVIEGLVVGSCRMPADLVERAAAMGYALSVPALATRHEGRVGFGLLLCGPLELDWWLRLDEDDRACGWMLPWLVRLKQSNKYSGAISRMVQQAGDEVVEIELRVVETPRGKYRGMSRIDAFFAGDQVGEVSQRFKDECPEWFDLPMGTVWTGKGKAERLWYVQEPDLPYRILVEYAREPIDLPRDHWESFLPRFPGETESFDFSLYD